VEILPFHFFMSSSVSKIFAVNLEDVRNRAKFLHVFGFSFFPGGGWASKFLHLPYKAQANYDHAAKFHGDRSTELRNLALKKKHLR